MAIGAIRHITVAIDGSRAAQSAVRYACELARSGATLSFCSTDPHETPEHLSDLCEAAMSQARALGIKADWHQSRLGLAEALAACAQEHASEAIVIGTDERKGLARLRGSVGESLMRVAGRPVIFVHETDKFRGGDIAVTISGYDASYFVLDAAIAIALALNRQLFLISEVSVRNGADYYAPGSHSDARFVVAAERASAAGVKSASSLGDGVGSIPNSLIELAERRDCAMIVTGLHDHSGIERFFNGSLAEEIVSEARIPVGVVHHAFHPEQ